MKKPIVQIAREFSLGNFESVFYYISDNVEWEIIGEKFFKGKSDVISNCKQTAKYFNSVETKFNVNDIISTESKVVIIGTAEFLRNGKRINFVQSSDIYKFDKVGMIERISSYCITKK